MKQLDSFKRKFDEELYSYLGKKKRSLDKLDSKGGELLTRIQTFLQYGGKRFRPALFYYAYESFSEKKDFDTLQFSFIFELFHTFALIHDDIIDHANLRRGNPTIHIRYGLHSGILSGDLALTLTDEIYLHLVTQSNLSVARITAMNSLFNTYKQELLVGQYLDSIHIEDREKIMKLKTADYSFVRPVLFALLFANVNNKTVKHWQILLTRLGVIFQMKDDYDGVFSDERLTGKSSFSDTQEGKNTSIVELLKQRASKKELNRFHSFFGKQTITPLDFTWYLNLLEEKKIKKDIVQQIQTECNKLQSELRENNCKDTSFYTLVQEIITYIDTF